MKADFKHVLSVKCLIDFNKVSVLSLIGYRDKLKIGLCVQTLEVLQDMIMPLGLFSPWQNVIQQTSTVAGVASW